MLRIVGLRRAVRVGLLAQDVQQGIPSKAPDGRFHSDCEPITYLAASARTAMLEVLARYPSPKRNAYRTLHVEVVVHSVLDLTDPATRRRYQVTKRLLTERSHSRCQRLAKRLRAEGVEAIWTFSRADREGRQLVVFLDLLSPLSAIHVRRVTSVRLPVHTVANRQSRRGKR